MGMNDEISKRLADHTWDNRIAIQVSEKLQKEKSRLKLIYSVLFFIVGSLVSLGYYYDSATNLSDEYYNLYSYIVGEEIALFEFVD
jgi:hypothetical protein